MNLSLVAQRIWDRVEIAATVRRGDGGHSGGGRADGTVASPPTAASGVLLVLACGLLASVSAALMPLLLAPQDATQPRLLLFPPWISEEHAFRLIIADGGRPISISHSYPLDMTGMVAAFPKGNAAQSVSFPLQLLLSAGCLTLPQRVPYAP